MIDFPPRLDAYSSSATLRPDLRSPARFLLWMMRVQRGVMLTEVFVSLGWFLAPALSPYVIGRAVDDGLLRGDLGATALWAGVLLALITVSTLTGLLWHTMAVRGWLVALYGTIELVVAKANQLGHVLPRRTPTGEVLSVSSSDSDTFGGVFETVARAAGALLVFLVVCGIVLTTSVRLGLIVLVAAPLMVGLSTALLRPLHTAQEVERTRSSALTSQATDIVAGLRILRGIGGETTFGSNYERQSQSTRQAGVVAGTWQGATQALSVLCAGLLLVVLTWQGAHEMAAGRLTAGQLISFFGYAVFLVGPIHSFFDLAQRWVQGLVSARKTITLLSIQPPWHDPAAPSALTDGDLVDEASGLTARQGELTVVVSAVPDDSAALADRLGRYLAQGTEPPEDVSSDELKGRAARRERARREAERAAIAEQDAALASRRWGVTLGGTDLSELRLDDVRRHVLVSDASSALFQGSLQQNLDPWGRTTREAAEVALRAACAEDVYDALPNGWQGELEEKGRGLSGGQRQRVILARALLADPPVLVLVEPTSAVDAHTEARIAERLAAVREGRTTVVTTVSPLLLHHADQVALLDEGRVVAAGTHAELLAGSAAYRQVVARGMDEADALVGSETR